MGCGVDHPTQRCRAVPVHSRCSVDQNSKYPGCTYNNYYTEWTNQFVTSISKKRRTGHDLSGGPRVVLALDFDSRPLLCKFLEERAVWVGVKRLNPPG